MYSFSYGLEIAQGSVSVRVCGWVSGWVCVCVCVVWVWVVTSDEDDGNMHSENIWCHSPLLPSLWCPLPLSCAPVYISLHTIRHIENKRCIRYSDFPFPPLLQCMKMAPGCRHGHRYRLLRGSAGGVSLFSLPFFILPPLHSPSLPLSLSLPVSTLLTYLHHHQE